MQKILVCGGTGQLGREVVRWLLAAGREVRVLTRDAGRAAALGPVAVHIGDARKPETLAPAFAGVDAVFSSVGASVSLKFSAGYRGYKAVDIPANRNLLAAARKAGAKRFVYVSAFVIPETSRYAYFAAHETVAREVLAAPDIDGRVLRPTAFFSALRPFVTMARRGGMLPVFGDGSKTSNPIHDADLAEAAAKMLLAAPGEGPREQDLGGPDVVSRAEIAGLAQDALGLPRKLRRVRPFFVRAGSVMLTPFSPRLAQLVRFATEVSVRDLVAPPTGTRHLGDYFAELVRSSK